MAVSVEENDAAYAVTKTAILKLADILQFTYIDTATSLQAARPPGPLPRYLFRALPHAAGVFAFEHVHVVCVAAMSALTFWEYVNERFGTEREPIPKAEGVEITLDSKVLASKVIRLPNDLNINISYARLLPDQCFKEDTFLVSKAVAQQRGPIARIYDVQHLCFALASSAAQFPGIYLLFRHWAFCNAILSRQFGYLREENLQHILATTMARMELDPALSPKRTLEALFTNVRTHRDFHQPIDLEWAPSDRRLPSRTSAENISAIEKTIAKSPPHQDESQWLADAWDMFTTAYNVFVRLRVRCWNSKQSQAAIDVLSDTAVALRVYLVKCTVPTGCSHARVWPHIDRSMSTGNDEASLLVGVASYIDNTRRHSVEDFLRQVTYDTSPFHISHDTLVKEQLSAPQLPLQEYTIRMPGMVAEARPKQDATTRPVSNGRFRTAGGVMERLRHDPAHASKDYEVGYVDRFEKGLVWKPLEKWERMTEEEEFVPEHRIRQVRNKADGMIVWDREKRLDRSNEA